MHLDAWTDQQTTDMAVTIRRFGWMIHYVGGAFCDRPGCEPAPSDEPPFAYTTGLFGMGHPELLIVAVDSDTASLVLNGLGDRVKQGDTIMPGFITACAGWDRRILPEEVPNPGAVLLWSNLFYRRPAQHSVPALQLTYTDTEGRFPWDEGYCAAEIQPRPGSFTA